MQGLPERSRPPVKRDVLLPRRPAISEKEILFRYAEFFLAVVGFHDEILLTTIVIEHITTSPFAPHSQSEILLTTVFLEEGALILVDKIAVLQSNLA